MKRMSKPLLSLSLLIIASAIFHHRASLAQSQDPGAAANSAVQARIARVEKGLLPPVIIKGRNEPGMKLADRMAFHKVRGVSIAVFDKSRIEWARGYGLADVAGNGAVTADTRFQAASISKPVSAAAVLHFVEAGKLDLDRDVNDYLKSWKVPENDFTRGQKVTLRRILSHSAGLTVHGFAGYEAGKAVPTLVQVLNGEAPANSEAIRVTLVPGSAFRYSGGGYTVMQQLLIDVLREPFPRIMQQTVLSKFGMSSSDFSQPLRDDWRGSAAAGYQADGTPVAGKYHTYPELAAAGLWTTPSDLARFAMGIQDAYAGKSHAVISQKMAQQMLTGQIDHVGLGVALDGSGQTLRFSHSGGNEGFQCLFVAYAHTGQGAVVMTNSDNGGELINEVMFGIAREYHWANFAPQERAVAKVDPKVYPDYVGRYMVRGGTIITISTRNHRLYAQATHEPEFELFPESPIKFFALVKDNEVVFERGASGKVDVMEIHQGGQSFPAKREQ
ncbi:MAG TPA: serine hydrolase [Terriglobia bacterium]|nr:serine hydrolase [Terriglobia bacterium]